MEMPARLGRVERGVQAELNGLAAAADYPGLAAVSRRLARVLDDDAEIAHHAAAARTLADILDRLHAQSRGRGGGKLLEMRQARRDE
jgi:hypothetical protein